LCNLKLGDINYERMSIHIRQGKGRKDRIVPLAAYMAEGLRRYIADEKPPTVGFLMERATTPITAVGGISSVMREVLKKTSIS